MCVCVCVYVYVYVFIMQSLSLITDNIRFDKDTYYDVGGRTLVAMVIAENVTETVNVTILTPGQLLCQPVSLFSSLSLARSLSLSL